MFLKSLDYAVKLSVWQWTLLRDNPLWTKYDALKDMDIDPEEVECLCFLCHYIYANFGADDCDGCPLDNCLEKGEPFQIWNSTHDTVTKCIAAQALLDKLFEWEDEQKPKGRDPLLCPEVGDVFRETGANWVYVFVRVPVAGDTIARRVYVLVNLETGNVWTAASEIPIDTLVGGDFEYVSHIGDIVENGVQQITKEDIGGEN